MKKEVKYALEALSGRLPREDKNLDWFYLLGFLELNRVAGAFLTTAEGLEMKLPPSVHRRLSAVRAEQADRVRFLRRWIEDIAYELDASGTEYVFLKGSILSHTQFAGKPVYASGERVSNDVDLLIRPKDAGRVSRALARIGFRQGSWDEKRGAFRPLSRLEIVARRMNRGETAPLIASTGNARFPFVEVDVNFSVDYLPFGQERLVEGMLLSRRRYPLDEKSGLAGASPEWFFLHLLLHQYKESVLYFAAERGKETDLYKFLDIYRILTGGYLNQETLKNISVLYGISYQVGSVLCAVSRLFGCELPAWVTVPAKEPPVLIPAANTSYEWTLPVEERISRFSRLPLLRDVKK